MALTTDEMEQAWQYALTQMQLRQVQELPPVPVGALLLTDTIIVKRMNQGTTNHTTLQEIASLIQTNTGAALPTPVLSLSVISDTQINAVWLAVAGATDYKLYRSATPDFADSTDVPSTGLSFNDTGRLPNTQYWYWLKAMASGRTDSPLATATITTTGAEVDTVPPVLISVVIGNDARYTLVIAYNEQLQPIPSANTTLWSIPGHTIAAVQVTGITVILTVTGAFTGGEAVRVNYTGSVVKDLAGNLAPTFTNQDASNLIVIETVQLSTPAFSVVAAGTDSIDVIWQAIPDGPNLGHYEIERSTDGTTWTSFKITTDGYAGSQVDSGLTPNTTYTYRLRSVSNGGNFTTSNWATASATTNLQAGYNTTFSFETSTSQQGAGVNASVLSTNNNIRLRFTAQSGGVGVNTMHILVSFQEQMRVDFPGAYIGQPFEFVDRAGVVHTDHFVNGNVRF